MLFARFPFLPYAPRIKVPSSHPRKSIIPQRMKGSMNE
jgi:hypothetical protein